MKICRSCGKCCLNTEMQLSTQDIISIEANNSEKLSKDQFCYNKEGFVLLKNIDNHCIFFDDKEIKCKIYSFRPMGCRFYPMVFDIDKNRCFIDDDCQYPKYFFTHRPEFKKKCRELRNWIKNNLIGNINNN